MLDVAERALEAASGDEIEAVVHYERSGLARFAASDVHQPTLIENTTVQVRVVRDRQVGWAMTNRLSDEGLADVARRAEEAAASAPADPAFPGLAAPESLPSVEGYDEATAALGAEEQARLAAAGIEAAGATEIYGFFTSAVTELAIASSRGVRARQRLTDASARVLAAGDDASGYAEATAWSAGHIDPAAVAEEAVAKAARTKGAYELEPGTYRAVLQHYALAELLDYFGFDTFNGLGLIEERSYFAGRLGERVFDEKISIADDALDPRGLPRSFDYEGAPKRRVALVEDGVARGVVWDRTTAARAGDGATSTGHAPPVEQRVWGPLASALVLAPGEAESTEALAELVGDGIHVTRLHYLSVVDPREGVITGMTRDGTFRIRDGRVAEPLVNLRFTLSMPQLLADVPGLTRDLRLVSRTDFYDARDPIGALVPSLATGSFTVTGSGSRPGL